MVQGFKNFLLRGDLIIIAVGLVVALAFNSLVMAFTNDVITPLINALAGSGLNHQGVGFSVNGQFINIGEFISAIVYFVIYMAVVYFALVVPYRTYMARGGTTVFGAPEPPPATKSCPECLSSDLPAAATKCLHCASVVA
jgi:large conductance mechanosensitive channel